MLCLKRKEGEKTSVVLEDGTPCEIVVVETARNWVRLGFNFPRSVQISREDVKHDPTVPKCA